MANKLLNTIKKVHSASRAIPQWLITALILTFAGVFLFGFIISVVDLKSQITKLEFLPFFICILICIPVTTALNALEFKILAKGLGKSISFRQSTKVTIVSVAANLAPVPAGAAARIAYLKKLGIDLKNGTLTVLLISFLWLSFSALLAAFFLSASNFNDIALLFGGFGFFTSITGLLLLRKNVASWFKALLLCFIRILLIGNDCLRIYLIFSALGYDYHLSQLVVLVVSWPLGSAASIIPAGLGVRELVAATLAPLAAVTASQAFLSTSLNRLIDLACFVPASLWILQRKNIQSDTLEQERH